MVSTTQSSIVPATSQSSILTTSSTTPQPTTTTTTEKQTSTERTSTTSNITQSITSTNGLSDGGKAGIAVGAVVFVSIIVAIIIFILMWRRKHNRRGSSDGEQQNLEINKHDDERQKRKENKYVRKDATQVNVPVYENPAVDPTLYENVNKQNYDSTDNNGQQHRPLKLSVMKQDSVPTAYAPPPPLERTSVPVDIAPACPAIDEDDYIVPEDRSKITVVKPPPRNNDMELYLDMSHAQCSEIYLNPDSGQNQENYMNFDVKAKILDDEKRKEGPKDYVNLSNQEKGAVYGVRPKEIHGTSPLETTTQVTNGDQENYQNVSYEDKSKPNKKPRRKK